MGNYLTNVARKSLHVSSYPAVTTSFMISPTLPSTKYAKHARFRPTLLHTVLYHVLYQ